MASDRQTSDKSPLSDFFLSPILPLAMTLKPRGSGLKTARFLFHPVFASVERCSHWRLNLPCKCRHTKILRRHLHTHRNTLCLRSVWTPTWQISINSRDEVAQQISPLYNCSCFVPPIPVVLLTGGADRNQSEMRVNMQADAHPGNQTEPTQVVYTTAEKNCMISDRTTTLK